MELIDGFILDCKARGMSHHGIQTYRSQVKKFLHTYPRPSAVKLDDLRSFLGDLRNRRLSGSTLKGYFAAINAFYDYLIFEGRIKDNPVPPFRKRYLSRLKLDQPGECRQLISIQDMRLLICSTSSPLELAIILFLAKTGIRRGELLNLTMDDLDFKNDIIRVPRAAKRSNRIAFMDPELKVVLREYLVWRDQRARSNWLWVTKHGGRIKKDYPGMILAKLGTDLGLHNKMGPLILRLTPHCLRHFFTTWLYRADMDPEYIKWLRGDSLEREAWQIYNHIDIEDVRQEYLRKIPRLITDQQIVYYQI